MACIFSEWAMMCLLSSTDLRAYWQAEVSDDFDAMLSIAALQLHAIAARAAADRCIHHTSAYTLAWLVHMFMSVWGLGEGGMGTHVCELQYADHETCASSQLCGCSYCISYLTVMPMACRYHCGRGCRRCADAGSVFGMAALLPAGACVYAPLESNFSAWFVTTSLQACALAPLLVCLQFCNQVKQAGICLGAHAGFCAQALQCTDISKFPSSESESRLAICAHTCPQAYSQPHPLLSVLHHPLTIPRQTHTPHSLDHASHCTCPVCSAILMPGTKATKARASC